MKVMHLIPGTPEWEAHRFNRFNASELAAAMGLSKKMKRSELLHLKATGNEREFSDYVRDVILASGHRAEELAREQVAIEIGEDLFPIIGVSDDDERLSASFDGVNLDEDESFECKVWNAKLVEQVRAGELSEADFPEHIYQMEQQLLINTKSESIRFVVAKEDGSDKVEMRYYSVPERRAKIIPTWNQFEADLRAYVPPVAKPEVVAAPVANLPAIVYEIERGTMALSSNLPAFRAATEALVERTKSPLVTDQDFADREALCKKMREAEAMLKAKADEVVGQIADVATFSRELKDLAEMFRTTALASEKLVAAEKTNRRNAIQQGGEQALAKHISGLQDRFAGRVQMPAYRADFAGAIKGKRTLESIQNAVDTLLAQGKIETNAMADEIDQNLRNLDAIQDENAGDFTFLFRDLQSIIMHPADAFAAVVRSRISEHLAKERARIEEMAEAAREKIRKEEQARAEAEARAREQAEAARRDAERQEAEAAERAESERRNAETAEAEQADAVTPPATQELAPQAPPAVAAPAIAAPTATPAKTAGMAEYAKLRHPLDRPSDQDMAASLARSFGVDHDEAVRWLLDIDRAELEQSLKLTETEKD